MTWRERATNRALVALVMVPLTGMLAVLAVWWALRYGRHVAVKRWARIAH